MCVKDDWHYVTTGKKCTQKGFFAGLTENEQQRRNSKHNTIFSRCLYLRSLKMRGDNAMMLFHTLRKYTAWLHFWWCERLPMHSKAERQVQGKNRTSHPARGAKSLGTIPATRSQPRLGCDPALPWSLWVDGLQLRVSVSRMCTKHQPWQAPRPPDRVHDVKVTMQSLYAMSDRQLSI